MTKLSVNVNKLASLRNARGKNNPNVLGMVLDIISYGAEGITVHPRPDGRHIRREDVYDIAGAISVEFNIEGYPDKNFLDLVKEIRPTQCTLVPDPPHVLTSNAGWKLGQQKDFLRDAVSFLHEAGVRSSLFIDPFQWQECDQEALLYTQTDRVELYTEAYADAFESPQEEAVLARYRQLAQSVNDLGVVINAGHDLDLHNLRRFVQEIPMVTEVSIGHALICDALYLGMEETIHRYLVCLR